jgi:outer membrane lipoprotein-sorting protein
LINSIKAYFVSAVVICLFSPCIFADEIDAATADFLTALHNKKQGSIAGRFEQTKQVTMLPVPLISKGNYNFSNDAVLSWNTLEPLEQHLIISEDGMFINDSGDKKAMSSSNDVVAKVFLSLFTRDFALLANYFNIESVSTDTNNWRLHLTPLSAGLSAYITEVFIAGGDNTESLTIVEANGDKTDVKLSPLSTEAAEP